MYDTKDVGKLEVIEDDAPEALKAFCTALDKAAMSGGTIPGKYKELMALAVAFAAQCRKCIEVHTSKAREIGASDQEIAEVVAIATALRAGARMHGAHAF